MATLLALPLELLVEVSSFLPTPDLSALRLTCKQIEKSLYEWFSQEFFTKKQFMLTDKSLQALIDISKHVSFSKKLTHVIIATNVFVDNIRHFRDDEAAAYWVQGYRDQQALMRTGVDYEMLVEAFQNLQNLKTVGIRDFNSDKRYRDGTGASWTSWGSTTVFKETGVQLHFAYFEKDFTPRLFQVLVRALGKAKAYPEEIEVLLRRGFLADTAFNLTTDFLLPTVRPLLQNLKKLYLTADPGLGYRHGSADTTFEKIQDGYSLGRFLDHTPNLTNLRLNLPHLQFDVNNNFLTWLSKPKSDGAGQAIGVYEPPPIELPHLTSLEFGQFQAEPETILAVIAKFAPSLRELSLWRLTLLQTSAPGLDAKPNKWAGLFANLAKLPHLQLSFLKVGLLRQEHHKTSFKAAGSDDAPYEAIREYSGPRMDVFLQALVDETVLQRPAESDKIVVPSDTEDDDEFDEDGMDIDDDDEEEGGSDDDEQ